MSTPWIFVRHGESEANRAGWLAGHRDPALTAAGRRQAAALAEVLAPRSLGRAFVSDLARARETADLLLQGREVPLSPLSLLRERDLGAWEGAHREALRSDGRLEVLMSWAGRPPGGESHRDVAERLLGWLATVPEGPPTLVVAHGALLRAALGFFQGVPLEEIGRWSLGNCGVVEVRAAPTDWAVALERLRSSGYRSP